MIDLKGLRRAIEELAEEKKLPADKVLEVIESSIAAAYKREYRQRGEIIKAKFDTKTGGMEFWQIKIVIDPKNLKDPEEEPVEGDERIVFNPERHILLAEAQELKKDAKVDDEISFPLEVHEEFGRIAAQTAKQ